MKKIVLILSILFMTGCSVKYDLTITNKEEVKEKFNVYIDNSEILSFYDTIDEYLDYYSTIYLENQGDQGYTIKTKQSKPQSYFTVKNNYKNLDEYIKSTTFLSMFDNATIERVGKYTSFMTGKNAYLESIKNGTLLSQGDEDRDFTIRIKFYNEVVSSNADSIDKKNNIYIWNVDKNTTKDYIYFKMGPKLKYNVMIKDYIQNNIASIIVISSAVIILAIAGGYIYIQAKKNNEV